MTASTSPRWTLRVTATGDRSARVVSRTQQFIVTRPLSFDAAQEGLSALEYALGALGAELVTGLREVARRRRVTLDNVEVVVTGTLENALAYLEVIGESGGSTLSQVALRLYVESPESEESVRAVCRDAIDLLPLIRTFRTHVRLDVEIVTTS